MPTIPWILIGACCVCTAWPAHAEDRPTFTKAADYLETSETLEVSLNAKVSFKKKPGAVSRLMSGGFQIRVFPIDQEDKFPRELAKIDDCFSYASLVKRFPGPTSSEILYGTTSAADLQLSRGGGQVWPGRYRLVFEKLDHGSAVDRNEVFRIHKDDAQEYMNTGFVLVVKTDGVRVEDVRAAYEGRSATLNELTKTSGKAPCFRYRRYALGAEPEDMPGMEAIACAPGDPAESVRF